MQKLQKTIHWLIYIFVFLLPLQTRLIYKQATLNGFNFEYGNLSLYATELLFGVILILSIIYALVKIKNTKKSQRKFNLRRLVLLILLISLVSLSCFLALNKEIAFYKFGHLILGAALLFIILAFRPNWTKMSWAFVWSGLIQAALAINQFATQHIVGNKWLGMAEQNPETMGVPVVQIGDLRWLRTFGTLPHPNILAGFLVISLILIIGLYYLTKIKKHLKILPVFFVINFLALLTTLSRAGILVFIISIIIFAFATRKNKAQSKVTTKFALITIIIFILFIVSFPELLQSRVLSANRLENLSNATRIEQYQQFGSIIKPNWKTGTGLGNYVLHIVEQNPTLEGWQYQPIHNTYLLIWAELGLIGLGFALLFIIYCLYNLFNAHTWPIEKRTSFICLICLAGLACFDHYLWSFWVGLLLVAIILGMNFTKIKNE